MINTYAYIDASNVFYGGAKSLGWSIDYEKLRKYLEEKYQVSVIYFFGGVDIHHFPFDYIKHDTVPIRELEAYLTDFIKEKGQFMTEAKLELLDRHLRRVLFYIKLERLGYKLILKPVKSYEDQNGNHRHKANCDVDMSFQLMRDCNAFDRVIFLSGDGDFLPVLKYLKERKKEVLILARGPRTAKEIKKFAGDKFLDFEYLRERIKYIDS
jgi:uncharacterized LabA/DUF88 family protein